MNLRIVKAILIMKTYRFITLKEEKYSDFILQKAEIAFFFCL